MLNMSGNVLIDSLPWCHVVAAPSRHLQRKFGGVFRERGVRSSARTSRNRDSKSTKVSTTRVLRVTAKKEQCCHNLQKAANRTQAMHARVKICNDFSRHPRNNPTAGGSIKFHRYQFWFKAISRGCLDSSYLVGWS